MLNYYALKNISVFLHTMATGYRKTQKLFTSRQVALIFEFLGEP